MTASVTRTDADGRREHHYGKLVEQQTAVDNTVDGLTASDDQLTAVDHADDGLDPRDGR